MSEVTRPTSGSFESSRPLPRDLSSREQKHRANVANKMQSAVRRTVPARAASPSKIPTLSPRNRSVSKERGDEEKTTGKVTSATSIHFSRRAPRQSFYSSQHQKGAGKLQGAEKPHQRSKSSSRTPDKKEAPPPLLRTVTPTGRPKVTPVGPPHRFAHLARIGRTNSDSTLLEEENDSSPHTSSSHTPSPHTRLREFSFPEQKSLKIFREDLKEFKIDQSKEELLRKLLENPNTFVCIIGTADSKNNSMAGDDSIEANKDRFFFWIKDDANSHRGSLRSYVFFREFLGEGAPKDLSKEEALLLAEQCKPVDIHNFYRKKLEKYPIPPEQVNLFFSSGPTIPECEALVQAAHNFAELITRIYEDFHDEYRGSTNQIKYFFDLIKNQQWLETVKELNLKGLALTWVPILSSLPFTNQLKINVQKNLLSEFSYRFFHNSNVVSFDASDNPTRLIAQDFGETWKEVEKVSLNRTQIASFPFNNFQDRLKEGLHIAGTSIEEIPEGLTYQVIK